MNFLNRSLLLTALLLSAASIRSFGDPIVVNGGFETGDFTGWTLIDASGFTSVSGSIVNHGNYAAALGAQGAPGTLGQTIADTAGTSYTLFFYLSSDFSGTNSLSLRVNGTGGLDLSDVMSGGFQRYSTTFTGTGSDMIQFSFRDDAAFLRLDDVSFTDAGLGSGGPVSPGPTPEPSGVVLLGTGLLSIAGLVRLRRIKL